MSSKNKTETIERVAKKNLYWMRKTLNEKLEKVEQELKKIKEIKLKKTKGNVGASNIFSKNKSNNKDNQLEIENYDNLRTPIILNNTDDEIVSINKPKYNNVTLSSSQKTNGNYLLTKDEFSQIKEEKPLNLENIKLAHSKAAAEDDMGELELDLKKSEIEYEIEKIDLAQKSVDKIFELLTKDVYLYNRTREEIDLIHQIREFKKQFENQTLNGGDKYEMAECIIKLTNIEEERRKLELKKEQERKSLELEMQRQKEEEKDKSIKEFLSRKTERDAEIEYQRQNNFDSEDFYYEGIPKGFCSRCGNLTEATKMHRGELLFLCHKHQTNNKKFTCQWCGKGFSTRNALDNHVCDAGVF